MATRGKGGLVGASWSPRGKVHRAGVCCPRSAQDVTGMVAWDATPWGGKGGAAERPHGAALWLQRGACREITTPYLTAEE